MVRMLLVLCFLVIAQNAMAVCNKDCAVQKIVKAGWLNKAKKESINVFINPQVLKRGTKLKVGPFQDKLPQVLSENMWLFFADYHPGALFGHQTAFLLVSKRTGKLIVQHKMGYPIVNGVDYFSDTTDAKVKSYIPKNFPRFFPISRMPIVNGPVLRTPLIRNITINSILEGLVVPDAPNPVNTGVVPDNQIDWAKYPPKENEIDQFYKQRVRGIYERHQSQGDFEREINKCGCAGGSGTKIGLFLGGLSKESERNYDRGIENWLYQNGYDTVSRNPHYSNVTMPREAITTRANVIAAFDQTAAKISSCCDEVLIVISGHGSPSSGAIDMNSYHEKRDPNNPNKIIKHGNPNGFHMTTRFLREQLNKIKSCNVKVIISSCFAGKHLENGINVINRNETAGCMCRTVISTSSARQVSYLGDTARFSDALTKHGGDLTAAFADIRKDMKDESARGYYFNQVPQVQSTDCILCEDPDGDGLMTGTEIAEGTDPHEIDSDNDGLTDMMEKEWQTDPNNPDSDGDGLIDGVEVSEIGTLPNNPDSDGDGINDKHEGFAGTDPTNPDTDGDGLKDGFELYELGTLPTKADTDDDGKSDGEEYENRTDPLDPNSN